MYLTYRHLSLFVHPSVTTFDRYPEELPVWGVATSRRGCMSVIVLVDKRLRGIV